MAYRVAAASGFRANELRSLPPERFRLDGDHPSIILKSPDAKTGEGTATDPSGPGRSAGPFPCRKALGAVRVPAPSRDRQGDPR